MDTPLVFERLALRLLSGFHCESREGCPKLRLDLTPSPKFFQLS